MRIAVPGASGATGKQVVNAAVAAGHEVVAISRGDVDFGALGKAVVVKRGDLCNLQFMEGAFDDCDAVVSCLGLRLKSLAPWAQPEVKDFLDDSTDAITMAMKARGVRRVVAISSSGVGDSAALLPAAFKVFMKVTALRHVMPALKRMEERYADSGLDATMCRPTGLTDGPATGKIIEATKLVGQAQISRANVATWMLKELSRPEIRRAVVITTTGAG